MFSLTISHLQTSRDTIPVVSRLGEEDVGILDEVLCVCIILHQTSYRNGKESWGR